MNTKSKSIFVGLLITKTKSIHNLNAIKSTLDAGYETVKVEMNERIGKDVAEAFLREHRKDYNKYIIEPNKQKQKELIEEGKEQEAKDVYIDSVKKYKSLISAKRNESSLSANEVILIVNSDNIPDSLDILKNLR